MEDSGSGLCSGALRGMEIEKALSTAFNTALRLARGTDTVQDTPKKITINDKSYQNARKATWSNMRVWVSQNDKFTNQEDLENAFRSWLGKKKGCRQANC